MTELFKPDRPKSLARRIATNPDATDGDITRWVADLTKGLWTEVRRALLRDFQLNQRVDQWVRESPHRECLQTILEDELADDLDLLATFGPATIEAWAEAFAVDAVQWSGDFPVCDRVLRHLGHDEAGSPLDRIRDADLARAQAAVMRIDRAFTGYDEAACTECGGLPRVDRRTRMIAAQTALDRMDGAAVEEMIRSGNAVRINGVVSVNGDRRAGRILLFAEPPSSATVDDERRRPPWFTRFVLEPRSRFFEGRPVGIAVDRIADGRQDHEPGTTDDA